MNNSIADLEDNVEEISQKVEQKDQGGRKQEMKSKELRGSNKRSDFQTSKWIEYNLLKNSTGKFLRTDV